MAKELGAGRVALRMPDIRTGTQDLRVQEPGGQESKGEVLGTFISETQEVASLMTLPQWGSLFSSTHNRKLFSSCLGPAGPSITPLSSGGCSGMEPRSGGPGEKRDWTPPPRSQGVHVASTCLAVTVEPGTVSHAFHALIHLFLNHNPVGSELLMSSFHRGGN
jgi:hypothetical protein